MFCEAAAGVALVTSLSVHKLQELGFSEEEKCVWLYGTFKLKLF